MEQPHQLTRPPPVPPRPPPSVVAPYAGYNHMQYAPRPQLPPLPPFPPHPHCYSDHFQYHLTQSSSSSSPSPPPPPSFQCVVVPPPSDNYPIPPPPPFHPSPPPPPPYTHVFAPPAPRLSQGPIPVLSPPQNPQHFPHNNQDLCNSNWVHHQGWEYHAAHYNEEDWATRAKAWASSKPVTENQHLQSQFQISGRLGENTQYLENYSQPDEHQFPDFQQPPVPGSSYQQSIAPHTAQYPVMPSHEQDLPSCVADMNLPYANRDATLFGESSANFIHPDISARHTSINRQEVPSSYTSVTARCDETVNLRESLYKQISPHVSLDTGPSMHLFCRPVFEDNMSFAHSGFPSSTPRDVIFEQPSDFVPRMTYNSSHHHLQPGYVRPDSGSAVWATDHVPVAPTVQNWLPAITPEISYSPMGPQMDPSMAMSSSLPGHPLSLFQGASKSNMQIQPPVPSTNPTFGVGPASTLFPTTGFSVDGSGISGFPDRPKKGSVPNWLREEIIKNKAVIASSTEKQQKEEMQAVDNGPGNGGQGYSKSLDSSRSSEDEEEDEDYVEAARIAAVNKEIKRILTEVLLKVTDELFGEIATRVINEDNSAPEVSNGYITQNGKAGPSSPFASKPHTSSRVLVPVKFQKLMTETMDRGQSISNSPEDVLGLASYASDDEAVGGERSNANGKGIFSDVSAVTTSTQHVVNETTGDDIQRRHPIPAVNEMVVKDTTQLVPNCVFQGPKTFSSERDENLKREDESRGRDGDKNRSDEIPKEGAVHEAMDDDTRVKLFRAGSVENEINKIKKYDETKNFDRTKEKHEKIVSRSKKRGGNYSMASKGKSGRDGSAVAYSSESSDDASDALKRRIYSRRTPSPGPIRSRRRQLSRSPNNSRHYQRRHSPPYSSSQKRTRGSDDRNMSPVHRRR